MFGYVTADVPNLYVKDLNLHKALYCGLCKSIGKTCGGVSRFALTYDLTFLSAFMHNVLGVDVKIEKQHCAAHWITRRAVAESTELSLRIARLNTILAYHKIKDDVSDEGKGGLKSVVFRNGYNRARLKEPVLDGIVKRNLEKLSACEKSGCDSVDICSDHFSVLMREVTEQLCGGKATTEILGAAYYLGKWIYLADALDDYDKDIKSKSFNVLVNIYGCETKKRLIEQNGAEIRGIFADIISALSENSSKIDYKFNHDLIDNVLYRGLIVKTKQITEGKRCKTTTKF